MALFCHIQKFKDLYMVGHSHTGVVAVSLIRYLYIIQT